MIYKQRSNKQQRVKLCGQRVSLLCLTHSNHERSVRRIGQAAVGIVARDDTVEPSVVSDFRIGCTSIYRSTYGSRSAPGSKKSICFGISDDDDEKSSADSPVELDRDRAGCDASVPGAFYTGDANIFFQKWNLFSKAQTDFG